MSHEPECPMKPIADGPVDFHRVFPDCICAELRACEQRVREAFTAGAVAGVQEMAAIRPARTLAEFREENAFIAGVQAARNAVAVIREPYLHPQYDYAIEDALAAIDALKGMSE